MVYGWSNSLYLAFATIATVGLLQTQAGFVKLYRDSDFKHKIAPLTTCYVLCSKLDDDASSAKWGGLKETGEMFERGFSMIEFFSRADCVEYFGKSKWFPVYAQSRDDVSFPSLFRLDGINDAVSSFMLFDTGHISNTVRVCDESATLDVTNGTLNDNHGDGSVSVGNNTVGHL